MIKKEKVYEIIDNVFKAYKGNKEEVIHLVNYIKQEIKSFKNHKCPKCNNKLEKKYKDQDKKDIWYCKKCDAFY